MPQLDVTHAVIAVVAAIAGQILKARGYSLPLLNLLLGGLKQTPATPAEPLPTLSSARATAWDTKWLLDQVRAIVDNRAPAKPPEEKATAVRNADGTWTCTFPSLNDIRRMEAANGPPPASPAAS